MKKRLLSLLLVFCSLITLLPTAALASDDSAYKNDAGACVASIFQEYKGYYYALWEVNGAISRHKADGSENKVLFSYGGFDDLNTLSRSDYYGTVKMTDAFVNMVIYKDKIYVSVAKNYYARGKDNKQYAAIYSMNLDGTDWKLVAKVSAEAFVGTGSGYRREDWCILNDRIYVAAALSVYSFNLDGSNMKNMNWKAYSDKMDNTGADGIHCIYGEYGYLGVRGRGSDGKYSLYRINLLTGKVSQYKTMDFGPRIEFGSGGWVYIHNYKKEWWRISADGSQKDGEYLGKNISDLVEYKGDLYYIDATTKTAYRSDGLGPVKQSQALTRTGDAEDLIIAGDYLIINEDFGRTVTDLKGTQATFTLAYEDKANYMDSSLINKHFAAVYRPTFVGAAQEGKITDPLSVRDIYFPNDVIKEGWYNLRLLYKYINIDAEGNAELRYNTPTTAYYIQKVGDFLYTVKTREGKYLSVAGDVKNGTRVTTSDTPMTWKMKFSNSGINEFSMAPADNEKYLANACERKFVDGTPIILWTWDDGRGGDLVNNYAIQLRPLDQNGKECPRYSIKMSDWARPLLSYIEETTLKNCGDDFTKPITRVQMAELIVGSTAEMMHQQVQNMPGAVVDTSVPKFTDTSNRSVWYLAYWNITSGVGNNKFDPNGTVTREQMASFLVRMMDYFNTKLYSSGHVPARTKGKLSQFKDGGQVSSWAKDAVATMVGSGYMSGSGGNVSPTGLCSIEQAVVLIDRIIAAYHKASSEGVLEDRFVANGKGPYDDGNFTISSELGGYLIMNAEGKAVLSQSQSQVFTRKRVGEWLYTLQAADGRYLGISGDPAMPEDGRQIILQAEPYVWHIGAIINGVAVRPLTSNTQYRMNVSGGNKAEGTPIIVYTSKAGTPAPGSGANYGYDKNETFVFTRVK